MKKEEIRNINTLIYEIKSTGSYHINQFGELVNGTTYGTEPLYKAVDILRICDRYRSDEE